MNGKTFSAFFRTLLTIAAFLIGLASFAQGTFTIKLKLVDSKTSEPVSFATASLTVKGEKTAAKYVL